MAHVARVGAYPRIAVLRPTLLVSLLPPSAGRLTEPHYSRQPSGASTSGVSYKYTILDTSGGRSAAQVPQLPQTSYQALNTPYAFFGLGRTNSYIKNLFAGAARTRVAALEIVIPNSKLVINDPPGRCRTSGTKSCICGSGSGVPWVGMTVLGTMVALAGGRAGAASE
jgi:integrin alpha FG-GAP repeat containing protein 1